MIGLETDLRLAEQRVAMLEKAQKEDDNGDFRILKQQLIHKSELLDKVKHLLTRAAINEKALRQRVRILNSSLFERLSREIIYILILSVIMPSCNSWSLSKPYQQFRSVM